MTLFGLPDGSGDSWFGQLFIMASYGFILYQAAVLIGNGSEKLLLIYGPGIVGGLLIPILGAVPDGAIVLVSGLSSDAQCQVSTGVGTLAGSTIMLLTIPWAGSLFLGCRDRDATGVAASKPNGRPKYTDGFQPCSSCVTTYANTVSGAKLMMLTSLSYLIVVIPAVVEKNASSATQIRIEHYPALIGFIICAVAFVAYGIFQVVDSRAQTVQELKQTKLKFIEWQKAVGHKIASTDVAIKMAFEKFDRDGNGTIDREELQAGFGQLGLTLNRSQVVEMMAEHQIDEDTNTMSFDEFRTSIKRWSRTILRQQSTNYVGALAHSTIDRVRKDEPRRSALITVEDDKRSKDPRSGLVQKQHPSYHSVDNAESAKLIPSSDAPNEKERLLEDMWNELTMSSAAEEDDDEEEPEEQYLHLSDAQLQMHALFELCLGTFLCCVFSDPMVDVIGEFSDTIGVSSFFVSFIVTPIASNAAEIYSSLLFAKKRTTEGISMGFSALYGAACMNNTFVLCIFCALVYFQRLQWTFVAETLVILLTIVVVGINGMRKTVTVWQGFVVISLFPLSLVLVAVLDTVLDDSTDC